ncbi:MAG: siroheme synthase, partial [Gammaproteobacteria bacterium]|nr:siroheme synthase [Gammaproteobacteria bacterium]
VYMGLSGIEQLTQNLVHNGLAPSTPAAVISRGTLVDQKVLCGTIVDIASKVREQQLPAPTTTIIGGVVNAAIHLKDS